MAGGTAEQAAEKLVCGEPTFYSLGRFASSETTSCASLVASARFSAACEAVPFPNLVEDMAGIEICQSSA
jgi:hypothetical protein